MPAAPPSASFRAFARFGVRTFGHILNPIVYNAAYPRMGLRTWFTPLAVSYFGANARAGLRSWNFSVGDAPPPAEPFYVFGRIACRVAASVVDITTHRAFGLLTADCAPSTVVASGSSSLDSQTAYEGT
jgi:hypothetical protein